MTDLKNRALEIIDQLHCEGSSMEHRDYSVIFDALEEIEPLCSRDEELKELWAQFCGVPIDPDTECMGEPFLGFPAGTHREDIWHWFDERHSKGVAYLMYNGIEDYVPETRRLYGLKKLCFECESKDCQFNHGGECRFALVHERKPRINDIDGCIDYDYQEGEGDFCLEAWDSFIEKEWRDGDE